VDSEIIVQAEQMRIGGISDERKKEIIGINGDDFDAGQRFECACGRFLCYNGTDK